jgi:protease-4
MTLTGSIGVFAGHFVVRDLLDWAGIHRFPQLRGASANLFGFDDPWTDTQRQAMTRSVRLLYDTFLTRVAANRHRTTDEIDAIARGRIWSGERAQQLGLVDSFGSLMDAIDRAKVLAGLPADARVDLVALPRPGLLAALASFGASAAADLQPEQLEELGTLLRALGLDRALRIPMLYGDGRGATRLDVDVEGLE